MNENKIILNQLNRSEQPTVPEGFFDHFFDTLMDEIDHQSGPLSQLSKRAKPEIPAGYFDQLLFEPADTENSGYLDQLAPSQLPEVPIGFFTEFPASVLQKIDDNNQTKSSRKQIIPLWLSLSVSSAAAALIVFFSVYNFNKQTTEPAMVATDNTEEEYDLYLSYLDESEIIDYIVESDIELNQEVAESDYDTYEDFSTEELEEYYLELL